MGKTSGNSTPRVKIGNASTIVLSVVALGLLGGYGYGAYWAMTRLPARFVNESSYMTGPATDGAPDQDAIENAYNQARVPIGVTAAALLAATAAAAGVVMNNRTVSLGAATLQQARERDEKDRTQWSEEQFSKRYQDAATQLGDTSAAVRFAGVYAMVRLAEEWEAHRQVCIDVLCAYLRMPAPTGQQRHADDSPPETKSVIGRAVAGMKGRNATPVRDDEPDSSAWRAEWEVRRAILQQIELHCRPADGKAWGPWSFLRYDLSWSTLDTFTISDAALEDLSLYGATTVKNSAINFLNVRFMSKVNVRQMRVQGGMGFSTGGAADLSFSDLCVDGGHLNIKHSTNRSNCVTISGTKLKNSAKLTLYVSDGSVSNSITGHNVRLSSGSELVLYGEALKNQAQHAIWLRGVYVEEGSRVSPHHMVFGQRLASLEWTTDSPVKKTGEAIIKFKVDTTNPADHILKAPLRGTP